MSYLLFVDDCILFFEVTKSEVLVLQQILKEYMERSGQCVNLDKLTVYFSTNLIEDFKLLISQKLVVCYLNDFKKYLGLPNIVGWHKKKVFKNLKERFKKRVDGWNMRFLSQVGQEIFIKSILQAIPTYSMAYVFLPKNLMRS